MVTVSRALVPGPTESLEFVLAHPVLLVGGIVLLGWGVHKMMLTTVRRWPRLAVGGLILDGVGAVVFLWLWLVPPVTVGWSIPFGVCVLSLTLNGLALRRARRRDAVSS